MLRNALLCCAAILMPLTALCAPAFTPLQPACFGMHLTFDDEFNGGRLDKKKWTAAGGVGQGNYAQDEWIPGNVSESDGTLHLDVCRDCHTPEHRAYGSAIATTRGKWTQEYGYFEARMKMPPQAHGLWPAFWLMPVAGGPPEIDVMEWLGVKPHDDHMTFHYASDNPETAEIGDMKTFTGPDFSKDYHIFGVLWLPGRIVWYVDGIKRHERTRDIAAVPMAMILDNAVGAVDWDHNAVDASSAFPAVAEVDWVRAWSEEGPVATPQEGFDGAVECVR